MPDSFIDTPHTELNDFIHRLAERLPAHRSLLGLTVSEIETLRANARTFSFLLSLHTSLPPNREIPREHHIAGLLSDHGAFEKAPDAKPLTQAVAIEAGIRRWIGSLVLRIRTAEAYTAQIGGELGLPDTRRPNIRDYHESENAHE